MEARSSRFGVVSGRTLTTAGRQLERTGDGAERPGGGRTQSVLTPLVTSVAHRFSPPLVGGVCVLSTGLALWIASSLEGGIAFASSTGWLLATLIVWLVTALGSWLLPLWLLKKTVRKVRAN